MRVYQRGSAASRVATIGEDHVAAPRLTGFYGLVPPFMRDETAREWGHQPWFLDGRLEGLRGAVLAARGFDYAQQAGGEQSEGGRLGDGGRNG
jgi:hypothetical protein